MSDATPPNIGHQPSKLAVSTLTYLNTGFLFHHATAPFCSQRVNVMELISAKEFPMSAAVYKVSPRHSLKAILTAMFPATSLSSLLAISASILALRPTSTYSTVLPVKRQLTSPSGFSLHAHGTGVKSTGSAQGNSSSVTVDNSHDTIVRTSSSSLLGVPHNGILVYC